MIIGTKDRTDHLKKKTYRTPERLAKETFTSFTGGDKILIAPLWADSVLEAGTSEVN